MCEKKNLPYCRTCRYIERTSSGQVFLRCKWHCEHRDGEVQRCHVQPHATACEHYIERTHELFGPALLAARDIEAGVPVSKALSRHGLVMAS